MRRFCATLLMAMAAVLFSLQYASAGLLLSQGFEDVPNLPTRGWYMINHSDPPGIMDWFNGDETLFPAQSGPVNAYAAANYANTSEGTISSWIISPVLNFTIVGKVSFWTRTVNQPKFPDRLEVRVSTSGSSTDIGKGANDVGVFDRVLLAVNPNLDPGGYPSAWKQYVIAGEDLPTSGSGRIAFRYFVTGATQEKGGNSDYIGIDTVEVFTKTPSIFPGR